jgi:hypothetical protein
VIGENSAPLPNCFRGHGTLIGAQAHSSEALGHFAVRIFAHKLVGGVAAPEIDAGDLKEFAGRLTKQLDQSAGMRALAGLACNPEQKFLKALIGPGSDALLGSNGTAARKSDCGTESGRKGFAIHKCLNLFGKVSFISF